MGGLRLHWDATQGWILDVPVALTEEQLHRVAKWAFEIQVQRWRSLMPGERKEEAARSLKALEQGKISQRLVDADNDGIITSFASTTRVKPTFYSFGG